MRISRSPPAAPLYRAVVAAAIPPRSARPEGAVRCRRKPHLSDGISDQDAPANPEDASDVGAGRSKPYQTFSKRIARSVHGCSGSLLRILPFERGFASLSSRAARSTRAAPGARSGCAGALASAQPRTAGLSDRPRVMLFSLPVPWSCDKKGKRRNDSGSKFCAAAVRPRPRQL